MFIDHRAFMRNSQINLPSATFYSCDQLSIISYTGFINYSKGSHLFNAIDLL